MQSHSRALEVVHRNGRWRDIHRVGLFPERLNFPPRVGTPESSRAVSPIPCCRPAATVACWRGVFWEGARMAIAGAAAGAGTGRERQQSLGDANQPEQIRSHPCPRSPAVLPSLPPRANPLRDTNAPNPSRRWHLQHLDRVVPLPITRAIYTSKAQGEKSNNLHTVTESNKHRHRPGGLPEPFCQAGSWASPQSPLPCGAPLTLTASFFCQTQTEGRARTRSLTLAQHLHFSGLASGSGVWS